jgi:putative flippase GtrA
LNGPDAGGGRLSELLRHPRAELLGQGVRYAISGATVSVFYIAATTVLSQVLGLPFQAALAIAFVASISLHFTLQRMFVWKRSQDFALSLAAQAKRYLPVAGTQYALTAASTATLPHALHVGVEFVYLATVALLTLANFFVFRHGVFHAA